MIKHSFLAALAVIVFALAPLPAPAGPAPADPATLRGSFAGFLTGGPNNPAGFARLTVSKTRKLTGRLFVGDDDAPLRGQFAEAGTYSGFVAFRDGRVATLDWTFSTVTGLITGTVTDGATVHQVSIGGNSSTLRSPNIHRGQYTMLLPAGPGADPDGPQSPGFVTLRVSNLGFVRGFGRLGDGAPFSIVTVLRNSGEAPVYRRVYTRPSGLVSGSLNFRNLARSDIDGTLAWSKPRQRRSLRLRTYLKGFETTIAAIGSRYELPPSGLILPVAAVASNANISLFSPAISRAFDRDLTVSSSTLPAVVNPGRDRLVVRLGLANGVIRGRFRDRGTFRSFVGVVFQKVPGGAGAFIMGRTTEPVSLTITQVAAK